MIDLKIQIPDSLYRQIEILATKEDLEIEELVSIALSAHVFARTPKKHIDKNQSGNSLEQFQQVLAKVPDVEPEGYKKL